MLRFVCLVLSVILYAASLFLPGGKDEGPPRAGFAYLVLGGYFFSGFLLVPANILCFLGWAELAQGFRRQTLVMGISGLSFGIVGVVLPAEFVLPYPAYWVWLASFIVLIVGGYNLPSTESSPKTPREEVKK